MKNKRGENTILTKYLGGDKRNNFKSKLLDDDKWILPLFVLCGLKGTVNIVDTYGLSAYFMREEVDELYEKISTALYKYANYISEKNPERFLAVLTTGMGHFDNPEIVESFYQDEQSRFLDKQRINEYDVSKYLFHGWKERNWYPNTLAAFKRMLPKHDIDLFVKIFAITSLRTHFKSNMTIALRVYDLFQKGKSLSKAGVQPVIQTMLKDFKEKKFTFSGEERDGRQKISKFARAILGDVNAVVVDSWVLDAYGLSEYYEWRGKICRYSPRITEYDLVQKHVQLLAKASQYEPRQIISMLWSGMKKVNSRHKATNTTRVLGEIINGR